MAHEMSALTLRIVVKTLFGAELDSDVQRIGAAFALSNKYISTRANQPPRARNLWHSLPVPFTRRFRRARADLDEVVYSLIAERRQSNGDGDDLLSLLLECEYEDDDGAIRSMTDEQVRNETVTLFAGRPRDHRRNPHLGVVSAGDASRLLRALPRRAGRGYRRPRANPGRPAQPDLHRPGPQRDAAAVPAHLVLGRMAYQPFELGGYRIPVGAFILAPQLIAQRDGRWFDEPLAFRPDRWTPEFRKTLPQFAYYPFGGGPRRCIGDGFAMMEAKLIMATIGQRWQLRHDPRHKPKMLPLISLRPKGGMPMYLEPR